MDINKYNHENSQHINYMKKLRSSPPNSLIQQKYKNYEGEYESSKIGSMNPVLIFIY